MHVSSELFTCLFQAARRIRDCCNLPFAANGPRETHWFRLENVLSRSVKFVGIEPAQGVLVLVPFRTQSNVSERNASQIQVDVFRLDNLMKNLLKGIGRKLIYKGKEGVEVRFLA